MRVDEGNSTVETSGETGSVSVDAASVKKLSRILSRNIYDMSGSFVREAWLNARESVDNRSVLEDTNSDDWRGQDSTRRTEIVLPAFRYTRQDDVSDILDTDDLENIFSNLENKHTSTVVESGTKTVITDTTRKDCTFSIRDYGTGMSKDDFAKLILSFGSSSKSEDNRFGGGMGIGSLSAFSVTDEIIFDCYKDGLHNAFRIMDFGEVVIHYIEDEPTTLDNGVRMTCSVDFSSDSSGSHRRKEDAEREYQMFISQCMSFLFFSSQYDSFRLVLPKQERSGFYGLYSSRNSNDNYINSGQHSFYALRGYEYDPSNKNVQVGTAIDSDGFKMNFGEVTNLICTNSDYYETTYQSNNIPVLIDGCIYRGVYSSSVMEELKNSIHKRIKKQTSDANLIRYAEIITKIIFDSINDENGFKFTFPLCVPVGHYSVENDMNPSREQVTVSPHDIDAWTAILSEKFIPTVMYYARIRNTIANEENKMTVLSGGSSSLSVHTEEQANLFLNAVEAIDVMEFDYESVFDSLSMFGKVDYDEDDIQKINNDETNTSVIAKITGSSIINNMINISDEITFEKFTRGKRHTYPTYFVDSNSNTRAAFKVRFKSTSRNSSYGYYYSSGRHYSNEIIPAVHNFSDYELVGKIDDMAVHITTSMSDESVLDILLSRLTDEDEKYLKENRVYSIYSSSFSYEKIDSRNDAANKSKELDSADSRIEKIIKEKDKGNSLAELIVNKVQNNEEFNCNSIHGMTGKYVDIKDSVLKVSPGVSDYDENDVLVIDLCGAKTITALQAGKIEQIVLNKKKATGTKSMGAKYGIFTIEDGKCSMDNSYIPTVMGEDGERGTGQVFIVRNTYKVSHQNPIGAIYSVLPNSSIEDSDNGRMIKGLVLDSNKAVPLPRRSTIKTDNGAYMANLDHSELKSLLAKIIPDESTVITLPRENMSIDSVHKTLKAYGHDKGEVYDNFTELINSKFKILSEEEQNEIATNALTDIVSEIVGESTIKRAIMNSMNSQDYFTNANRLGEVFAEINPESHIKSYLTSMVVHSCADDKDKTPKELIKELGTWFQAYLTSISGVHTRQNKSHVIPVVLTRIAIANGVVPEYDAALEEIASSTGGEKWMINASNKLNSDAIGNATGFIRTMIPHSTHSDWVNDSLVNAVVEKITK